MLHTHDDPADLLRAVAAEYGDMAIEAATGRYMERFCEADPVEARTWLMVPVRANFDALAAAHNARRAWRYALAARLLTNVAAILNVEPTPPDP